MEGRHSEKALISPALSSGEGRDTKIGEQNSPVAYYTDNEELITGWHNLCTVK